MGYLDDLGMNFAESAFNANISRDLADQNWKRQKKVMRNAVYWRMKDLEQSGINPILAARGALGGMSTGFSSPGTFSPGSSGTGYSARQMSAKAQRKQAETMERVAGADISKKGAEEMEAYTRAGKNVAESKNASAQALKADADRRKAERETQYIDVKEAIDDIKRQLFELDIPKGKAESDAYSDEAIRDAVWYEKLFGQSVGGTIASGAKGLATVGRGLGKMRNALKAQAAAGKTLKAGKSVRKQTRIRAKTRYKRKSKMLKDPPKETDIPY